MTIKTYKTVHSFLKYYYIIDKVLSILLKVQEQSLIDTSNALPRVFFSNLDASRSTRGRR